MPKKSGLVTQREKEISKRVKKFREMINWPQPAFAAELEITRDRLASIEYARTPLRYDIGYTLCYIFDVNHHWLATGTGEMRAATSAAELPLPESLHPHTLFSEVWDKLRKTPPAAAKKSAGKKKEGELIPGFDPAGYTAKTMADLLAKERFASPLERQEFALELTSYARELALRIKRQGNRDRQVTASQRALPTPATRQAVKLQTGVERLEREVAKIAADMNKINPVSVDPSNLPPAVAEELTRCQEAIDKLTAQIEEAEGKIRAAMSRHGG